MLKIFRAVIESGDDYDTFSTSEALFSNKEAAVEWLDIHCAKTAPRDKWTTYTAENRNFFDPIGIRYLAYITEEHLFDNAKAAIDDYDVRSREFLEKLYKR